MDMRIGGRAAASSDAAWIDVKNPATGETVDRVPAGTADDIGAAVDAAEEAFAAWSKKTMRERGMILFHAARIVRERHRDLARLLTTEQGKPLRESVDEVRGFANILEFYAGISAQPAGEAIDLGSGGDCMVVREPLGVCGAIIPWNMPVLIMGWKAAPALLAGNTVVLKPASTAPLTDLAIAALLDEAGLVPGALNVITGSGETAGEALVRHPRVPRISFTGNCVTGHHIRELAGAHLKEVTLELGGSDPMIVMPDADLAKAAEGAIRGRFYNAGQLCTAVKRLFVHESVAGEFLRMLETRSAALNLGNGLDRGVDMGPLNSPAQRERIESLMERVRDRAEGTVVTGGSAPGGGALSQGLFYSPTIVSDVVPESRLLTEEVFGPVLPVVPFGDLDAAITASNRTQFGLGASIWTRDLANVKKVFSGVHAGVVWVNRHLTVPPEIPFGGVSESGIGRENGPRAIDSYTRTKTLYLGW